MVAQFSTGILAHFSISIYSIEMREAQKSLLDAEERILTAQYNTKLCEISLQQISGNVMVYLE